MELSFQISDNPNHKGIKRKAFIDVNQTDITKERNILMVVIKHYKNEDGAYGECLDSNPNFKPVKQPLVAYKDMVNPENGEFVDKIYKDEEGNLVTLESGLAKTGEYPEGSITEFEYWSKFDPVANGCYEEGDGMLDIQTKVFALVISKKDSEGRFN